MNQKTPRWPGWATAWFTAWFLATAPVASAQTAAPAPPPPQPIAFDDALLRAANDLLSKATLPADGGKVFLVIDPLIDGVSGAQSVATRLIEKRIVALVRESYPRFLVQPFSGEALARSPFVLIGTLTAVNNAGAADGPRDAYRICLALADLQTKTIASKAATRAKPEGIDVTPTPAFADSPAWTNDPPTMSYIKSCQASKLGEPLDPDYVARIGTSALISDAILEYDATGYREALAFYHTALGMPGGKQLRVHTGLYLTNWKLNRRDDATEAFGSLVDYGLAAQKLSVRFLFKTGSTRFLEDQQITEPYQVWLSQIATRTRGRDACLEVVGHTSPTGPVALNERLSLRRAEAIKEMLQKAAPGLDKRLIAKGVGPREALIGTGRDDTSDAIDRRVDFKVTKC